jgi:DNA-binding beta-propeller fold protein YncE
MRLKQWLLVVIALSFVLVISCDDDGIRPEKKDIKFWMLVRQVGTPANGEIVLYNLTDSLIERRFSVPPGLVSPHALAWDGASLWIGGAASNDSIYEIDPDDGTILHTIAGKRTEGIAIAGSTIWYSTVSPIADSLIQINREGIALRKIPVADAVINDLDTNGEWIYYAVNDDIDRIVRVDPVTGAASDFISDTFDGGKLYTVAIHGEYLFVIDDQNQGNTLRTFNRETGEFISDTRVYIDGWITGLRRAD